MTYIKKIDEGAYGEIKLMRNKTTGQDLALKTFVISTQKGSEEMNFKISRLQEASSINAIVRLIYARKEEHDELCAKFTKFHLYFEFCNDNLEFKLS